MKKVFIQINETGAEWDSVPVIESTFKDREGCVEFANKTAEIMNCQVRLSFPLDNWKPEAGDTIQKYAGRLSGSYYNPKQN